MRSACIIVLVTLAGSGAWTQNQTARDAVVARAKTLELDTPYVPPPGDPLEHHAAGYAKIVCSAVFVSGFEPAFASENLGYFVAPYDERAKLGASVSNSTGGSVRCASCSACCNRSPATPAACSRVQ
jgi:hypothetical protein